MNIIRTGMAQLLQLKDSPADLYKGTYRRSSALSKVRFEFRWEGSIQPRA